jgi:hypothetical protein
MGRTNQPIPFPFREFSTLCSQENFRLGSDSAEFGVGNSLRGLLGGFGHVRVPGIGRKRTVAYLLFFRKRNFKHFETRGALRRQ